MPKFRVPVVRTYSARHLAYIEVEAADADAAGEVAQGLLEEDSSHDPEDYENSHDSEGYDDAGSWRVDPLEGRAVEEVSATFTGSSVPSLYYEMQQDGDDAALLAIIGRWLDTLPQEYLSDLSAFIAEHTGPDADLSEAADGDTCSACGRESIDCSRDPCADVITDREA